MFVKLLQQRYCGLKGSQYIFVQAIFYPTVNRKDTDKLFLKKDRQYYHPFYTNRTQYIINRFFSFYLIQVLPEYNFRCIGKFLNSLYIRLDGHSKFVTVMAHILVQVFKTIINHPAVQLYNGH